MINKTLYETPIAKPVLMPFLNAYTNGFYTFELYNYRRMIINNYLQA